ncbi:oxygen-dependent protoporphyrinogen oxidase [Poseidonocella pacifica]|uniref:Oxygen-dependent protoporphyrinogen oxidase n=1 Tax=Poseidonocella pacifica TaxID=871651 RepID=A0A1I0YW61_9RHOB|nr:NAD(P)/FAD-dependent oxidoreductase [Poseidonocella pacifica]SFB17056.1 oxygen-dependent protoporphyrinogen oxidase [Poseidonocella pacifica]
MTQPIADSDRLRDVIVVGGGLAGLTAAYRLRDRDVLVLEAAPRAGGRVCSVLHGSVPLNLGAHMFSGLGTPVGDLVAELGLTRTPIRGALMAMSLGGQHMQGRPELWPLRLPMSPRARASFVKMGLRLRWGAARMARAMANGTDATFEDHRTLAQFIGPLHPQVATMLAALTERSGGDPATMSAGHALRSFTYVWSGQAPGANLSGGSQRMIDALVAAIGTDRVVTNTPVTQVRDSGDHVCVDLAGTQLRAKRCIVSTPAPIARTVLSGLPDACKTALGQITYGAFLSVALGVRGAAPWRGAYALATPDAPLSVMFDQGTGTDTGTLSSLMLFRGAAGAAQLAALSDDALTECAHRHLHDLFPGSAFQIETTHIARWPHGAPVAQPGRATLQAPLQMPLGRIALAGDYFHSPNMAAAITSAERAVALTRADPVPVA